MTAVMPPAARPRPGIPLPTAAVAQTATSGSLRLAGAHFAVAMFYAVAGAVGLVWIAPELAMGAFPSPHVAGVTHLFTLGWLTTTIFGALCQLLPVALGAPLRSVRVGHAGILAYAPGVGLFATGVASGSMALRVSGLLLVATGILLAAWNVATTLPRARSRDATWWGIALGFAFLVATLALGLVLLHNLHTGFIARARLRVLAAHLHLALVGWVLVMIVGVSHRLLPMFLLSEHPDRRWTACALALLASGTAILATGLVVASTPVSWAGAVLIELGLGAFLWQAWGLYRRRVRRRLDPGMRFAGTALGFLMIAAVMGPMALAGGVAHARLATMYVATGLLGGLVLYVAGFFWKIVPLLAWTVRYGGRMGKGRVPTVADLFSARLAHVQLLLMASAVVLVAGGIDAGSAALVRAGALFYLAGVLLFAGQMARVTFGGRT